MLVLLVYHKVVDYIVCVYVSYCTMEYFYMLLSDASWILPRILLAVLLYS